MRVILSSNTEQHRFKLFIKTGILHGFFGKFNSVVQDICKYYDNKQHIDFRGKLFSMKGTELVKLLFASSKVNYFYICCLFYSSLYMGTSIPTGK